MKAFKILLLKTDTEERFVSRTAKYPREWGLLQKKILHPMSSNYY